MNIFYSILRLWRIVYCSHQYIHLVFTWFGRTSADNGLGLIRFSIRKEVLRLFKFLQSFF